MKIILEPACGVWHTPPLLWLHWVFVAVHRLFSSCGERWLLFVAWASHCGVFSLLPSMGSRCAGSVVVVRRLQ